MNIRAFAVVCLSLVCTAVAARELHSYALVQDDGSLSIEGKRVHLYGIHLAETTRRCRTGVSPARCAPRAVLALDAKIQGFVHCFPQTENADGSLNAICYTDRGAFDEGADLAAYLLKHGWALALPHAPFEYHAFERIARQRHLGVWGLAVDRVTEP